MQIAQTLNIGQEAVTQGLPGSTGYNEALPGGGVAPIISVILSAVIAISALLVFINLITGAIGWITAGSDKGKVEKARDQMTQSVIGIFVLAASLAFFVFLQSVLGINVLGINVLGIRQGKGAPSGIEAPLNSSETVPNDSQQGRSNSIWL